MLHYVSLQVDDLERSATFYDTLLAPLGWRRFPAGRDDAVGWGTTRRGVFYITTAGDGPRPGFGHVSFPANSIPATKAAYEAGIRAGGVSISEPGGQPELGPGTYSARLSDPDGYRIELAVATD